MSNELSPDTITKIGKDIALGKKPKGYTVDEMRCYKRMKAEIEAFRKKNPKARLDVYGNIDGL